MQAQLLLLIALSFLFVSEVAHSACDCNVSNEPTANKNKSLKLKISAIFSILICSSIGICIPMLGKWFPQIQPEKDIFFIIKAFAAGVILATGFIHILPDAFNKLSSPCLDPHPWLDFPFAGFGAMVSAIGTLMIDTIATGYLKRLHFRKSGAVASEEMKTDEENDNVGHAAHVHLHTHATHGHSHGANVLSTEVQNSNDHLIRQRVISQVLELGIVVHSIIIGISMGASESLSTIKPLIAALSFHQFFEGIGLGGCIVQAKFKLKSFVTMGLFFSLTTPIGIVIGIIIASSYSELSPTALIVEGVLNSASAGILIYMALVDLLAEDFMNPKVQSNGMLQVFINISLLIGAGLMSLLAKWS